MDLLFGAESSREDETPVNSRPTGAGTGREPCRFELVQKRKVNIFPPGSSKNESAMDVEECSRLENNEW